MMRVTSILSAALLGALVHATAYAEGAIESKSAVSPTELLQKAEAGDANSEFAAAYLILTGKLSAPLIAAKDPQSADKMAVSFLTRAVAAGNAPAEQLLGTLYLSGRGVTKDPERARGLFQMAADAGNLDAQNALGQMLRKGEGGPQDYAAALSLFEQAAAKGHMPAVTNLGYMYANGIGVTQDLKKAVELTRTAAESGVTEAQHNLGRMYQDGVGVEKNPQEAVRWYLLAAEKGYTPSQLNVGFIYAVGEAGGDVRAQMVEAVKWFALASTSKEQATRDTGRKATVYVAERVPADVLTEGMDAAKKWAWNH